LPLYLIRSLCGQLGSGQAFGWIGFEHLQHNLCNVLGKVTQNVKHNKVGQALSCQVLIDDLDSTGGIAIGDGLVQ